VTAPLTPWTGSATPIHMLDEPVPKCRLAIGRLSNGFLVLDDLASAERLGPVDLISLFALEVDGQEHIVVAGRDDSATSVTLEWAADDDELCRVVSGAWLSLPRPFVPGRTLTVRWHHDDGELRFTTLGPLHSHALIPRSQPWTPYAST
jgi:hypothetical protein